MTKYVTEFGYSDHRRIEIVRNKSGGGSNATTSGGGGDLEYKCVLVEDDNTEVEEAAYIDSIFSRSFHDDDFNKDGDHDAEEQVTSVDGLHQHVVRRSHAVGDGTRPSPSHLAILAKRRQQIYNNIGVSGGKAMSSTERQLHKILTSGEASSAPPSTEQLQRCSSASFSPGRSPTRGSSPRRPLSRRNSSTAEIFANLARRESDGAALSGNGTVSQVFAAEERRSAAALGRNKHRIVHEGLKSTIKMLEGSATTTLAGSTPHSGRKPTSSPHPNGNDSSAHATQSTRKQQGQQGGLVARLYPAPPPYRSSPRAQVEQAKDGEAARLYVNQSGGPSPSGSPTRSSSSAGTRAVEGGKRPLIDYSPRRPASSFSSSDFTSAPPPPLRPGEGRGQNLVAVGSDAGVTMTASERLMLQGGIRRDVAYVTRGVWLAQPPQFHSIVMPPSDPVFPERSSRLVPTTGTSSSTRPRSSSVNRHQTESLWRSTVEDGASAMDDATPSAPTSTANLSNATTKEVVLPKGMDSVDYALSKAASLHSRVQLVRDEKQRKIEISRKGGIGGASSAAPTPTSPRGTTNNTAASSGSASNAVRPPTAPMAVRLNRVFSSVDPSPLQFTTSPRGTHHNNNRATSARGPRGGAAEVDPLDRYVVSSPRRTSTTSSTTASSATLFKKGSQKI